MRSSWLAADTLAEMEVLKNLSEAELTSLRDRFLRANNHALSMDEFDEVLTSACASKPTIDASALHLRELFNDIDVNGDNTVSWDEFTMFLISGNPSAAEHLNDDGGREIKQYTHVKTIVGSEIPNSVVETRYIPKLDKVLRVMRRDKSSRLRLCYPNASLSTHLEVPRSECPMLSAEYIPFSSEVQRSGSVAVSFSDCVVRFYDTRPSPLQGAGMREMPLVKEIQLLESQSVIRWSTRYHRMLMGSRTGVVSALEIDESAVLTSEKFHDLYISDICLSGDLLFSASLDANSSVKCIDLERNTVRFALDGHAQGTTLLATGDNGQLYSAGFELFALAHSIALPKLKPYRLEDLHRPHKGRIIGVQAIPGSPQVITADSTGLVKVWDVRMYSCVQNIIPTKDDVRDVPSTGTITSIGFLPTQRRLVVNGRDTMLYACDEAGDQHLSDDHNCTTAVYNPKSHSFLSVHDNAVKLWDAVTGAPRLLQRNVVPADITCICLATPLCRRFFAGTMDGTLYSMGYAMGSVLRVYDDLADASNAGRSTAEGSEGASGRQRGGSAAHRSVDSDPYARAIVSLHYMEAFRDTGHSYVVVGMSRHVVLVPDAEEHVQRSVLGLHCLDDVLTGSALVTHVSVIHTNFVVVATSNGHIHVVDLATFALVCSYGREVLRGELSSLWVHSLGGVAYSGAAIVFVSDASGNAHCAAASSPQVWAPLHTWSATGYAAFQRAAADEAPATLPPLAEVELSGLPQTKRRKKRNEKLSVQARRMSLGLANGDLVTSSESLSRPLSPRAELAEGDDTGRSKGAARGVQHPTVRPSSVVREYFRPDRRVDIFTAFVTCMAFSSDEGLLVVGDDKGYVAVWDVSASVAALESRAAYAVGGARQGRSPPPHAPCHPPSLVSFWECHCDEVRSISLFQRDGRTCVLTTSLDKTARISSLDGTGLGNLAQGRTELEQTGDTSRKIDPFLVNSVPGEAWSQYDKYKAEVQMKRDGERLQSRTEGSRNEQPSPRPPRPPSGLVTNLSRDAFFLTNVDSSAPVALGSGQARPTGGSLSAETHRASGGASHRVPLPPRLKGIVKADTFKGRGVAVASAGARPDPIPPLSHAALPPISPRRAIAGDALTPFPTRVGEVLGHTEYVRQNLCANSAIIPEVSVGPVPQSPLSSARYSPQSSLHATPRLSSPRLANPLRSMDGRTKAYLRTQGHNDNPFETLKEHSLRTKGNVILGNFTEASNRVI